MMGKYEKLYESGADEADIAKIKKDFADKAVITAWEDYYWAAKCIVKYDTSDVDPKFISGMLNNSLKYGLTYRSNKVFYLDAIKTLASVYALMGKYELVLNCLNSVIELDSDAPDWVFHELVSAQNKTRSIKKNLKRPAMFLADLARNDGNKPETRKKQENIFKEFLESGIVYIVGNPGAIVDMASITDAATGYGLTDTREWKAFVETCSGKVPEQIKNRAAQIMQEEELYKRQDEQKDTERIEEKIVKSRPLVISLFKEEATDDSKNANEVKQDKELIGKLSFKQAELDSKNKELETTGAVLEKLTEINKSLQASVEKSQVNKMDYEKKLAEKDKNIELLNKKLKSVDKGSTEREKIEKQLISEQTEKQKLAKQVDEVNKNLAESQRKLKDAEAQKQKTVIENENSKDELLKTQNTYNADIANYEKQLDEKDKRIKDLSKKLESTETGSAERERIEKQLVSEQAEKQKLLKQVDEVNKNLAEAQRKLKVAEVNKQKAAIENKNLKDKLQKAQDTYNADRANYERRLDEKDKRIEDLSKKLESTEMGSAERERIEKQLVSEQAEKQKLLKQVDEVNKNLAEAQRKLKVAEVNKQKAAIENENLKDKLQKAQGTHNVDKANYERQLTEKNKCIEDLSEKLKSAREGSREKKELEKQIKQLKEELIKAQSENKKFTANTAMSIRGQCKAFEYDISVKTASWLTNQLLIVYGGWGEYITPALTMDQKTRAEEGHYRELKDFDLAALLRIFLRNWRTLCRRGGFKESDRETVKQMVGVRNNLAHSNAAPIDKSAVVKDLEVMSNFLKLLGFRVNAAQIATYAKDVAAMELA